MVCSFAVRTDRSETLRKEYKEKLDGMNIVDLVNEFFSYLDYTEESESGREFHPISIGSCRCLMSEPLQMCITKLREKAK